jgi:hypothetical protein
MTDNLKQLTRDDFEAHIGDEFIINLEDDNGNIEAYTLELSEIRGIGVKERDIENFGRESFSLHFRNPDTSRYLRQQMYPVRHDAFDNLTLFIVPLGPEDDSMVYEVIFT